MIRAARGLLRLGDRAAGQLPDGGEGLPGRLPLLRELHRRRVRRAIRRRHEIARACWSRSSRPDSGYLDHADRPGRHDDRPVDAVLPAGLGGRRRTSAWRTTRSRGSTRIVGCIAVTVVAVFIVVVCSTHLHARGIRDRDRRRRRPRPRARSPGSYAAYLFAFGLLNASVFAASILPLSTSYTICEGLGLGVGRRTRASTRRRSSTSSTPR